MPYGPGTYGSKVGRPKKSAAKRPRMKPLTSGQKKIARAAGNPNKIEGKDFKALRKRRGLM